MEAIVSPMVIIVGNKKCWNKVNSFYSNVVLMTPEQYDRQFKGVDMSNHPNLKVIDLRKHPDLWEDE